MGRVTIVVVVLGLAGCTFRPGGPVGDDVDAADDATVADGGTDAGDGDAAMIDAAMIDAPVIDAAVDAPPIDAPTDAPTDAAIDARPSCPGTYGTLVGATHYSLRITGASLAAAVAACDGDLPGRTHLATFEGNDVDAVFTAAGADTSAEFYVGAVCTMTGAVCNLRANWVWMISNQPVTTSLWTTGEPSASVVKSFASRTSGAWHLSSSPGAIDRGYLCECEP